ncbi:uncharacterized protein LOC129216703 [Uloborus diversus]|uniref:uncharacterized protein LOC129216703 n=1 Tax=Uloborus diversus TaxID=327109 RepID=UPI00240A8315|nr:uncharacterized protein LOC129216703 [Uloborus diversus]
MAFDMCEMSYRVALYDCTSGAPDVEAKPLHSWIGVANSSLLVLHCSKRMLEYFKKYCVSVSLKPFATCIKGLGNRQELFIFQYIPENQLLGYDTFSPLLCRHWNVSVLLTGDSSKKTISIHLRLCAGMKKLSGCFKFYQLQLYSLRSEECRPTYGIRSHSTQLVIPYNEARTTH